MVDTNQAPAPARVLNPAEILAVANELALEAALTKRRAMLSRNQASRAFILSEARLLEEWAFRLTQAIP